MEQKRPKTKEEKEAILVEYLTGEHSYRELGRKYGVNFRRIHLWVTKFKGKPLSRGKPAVQNDQVSKPEKLPADILQLQEELRKAKLYNELLNTMIDIAEDQLNIDIRKKSGTKQ